jgi:uncharacterized protein (DUF1810 family)
MAFCPAIALFQRSQNDTKKLKKKLDKLFGGWYRLEKN